VSLTAFLVVAACLFALGCFSLLARRQLAGMVIGVQLMGLGAVVALLAFDRFQAANHPSRGEAFAVLMAVAGVATGAVGVVLAQLNGADAGEPEEESAGR
jgi:NADH:ubiquinone oxidoreductase subunit K